MNINEEDLEKQLSNPILENKIEFIHSNNEIPLENYVSKLEKEGCKLCPLGLSTPKVVVSKGSLKSRLIIIGQNPGFKELQEGIPFIGPSGILLDTMLEKSGLNKANPYFTNVGLCGTPNNRPLDEMEQQKCNIHWKTQVLHLRPKIILAVGKPAINTIVPETKSLLVSKIIKDQFEYDNKHEKIPVYTIYHPSFILRQDNQDIYINETIIQMKKIVEHLKSIPKSETLF